MAGWVDIVNAVGAQLAYVAPFAIGKAAAQNFAPPYYRVFPLGERYAAPQGPGNAKNPRALYTRIVGVAIESHGKDFPTCEVLNQALVTAIRSVVQGASLTLGQAQWDDPENLQGWPRITLPVEFIMAMPSSALPATQAAADINVASTGFPVVDATIPTVAITSVGPDNTTTVQGDGLLDWGESS